MRALLKTKFSKIRLISGLTQKELGVKINKSRQIISLYERGEAIPPKKVQEGIAKVLGVERTLIFPPEGD